MKNNEMTKDIQHLLGFVIEKDAVNEEQRRIRFVISTNKVDRDNERVEMQAIADSIPVFAKNPSALACHLHRLESGRAPVIGSWDTDSFKVYATRCEMDLVFATTELGEEYFQLYKDKHMRAVSIGYLPQEWHEEKDSKNGRVFVITKLELVEISCVAVGANRDALSKIKAYYLQQEKQENSFPEDVVETIRKTVESQVKTCIDNFAIRLDDQLDEIKSLLITDSEGLAKSLLGTSSEQSSPGGAKNFTEQQLVNVFEKVISNIKNN